MKQIAKVQRDRILMAIMRQNERDCLRSRVLIVPQKRQDLSVADALPPVEKRRIEYWD